jgi:glycosyltransferase involved in cell wall biosynthesis
MKLHVGGLGLRGDGYPNAVRTIALLREQDDIDVVDCNGWLPEGLHLWKLVRMRWWRGLGWLLVLVFGNLWSLIRVAIRTREKGDCAYVPYPAIFFLSWLSLVPRRLRPFCIADSYISIWDAMYRDRSASKAGSIASRIIKHLEGRALRAAAMVMVDTKANRLDLIREFQLHPSRVRSIPLAVDESKLVVCSPPSPKPQGRVRVLFVGTLIPLHGIRTILDAFSMLADDPRLEFRLIGDGQQADLVMDYIGAHGAARLTWIREWCPLDRIAREIAEADICLGVFGGEGKAARVLPFKLYLYLACGAAIISQSSLSTPEDVPFPPIKAVAPSDPAELAHAIQHLSKDPIERHHMACHGQDFYRRWLANECVANAWIEMLGNPNRQDSDIA